MADFVNKEFYPFFLIATIINHKLRYNLKLDDEQTKQLEIFKFLIPIFDRLSSDKNLNINTLSELQDNKFQPLIPEQNTSENKIVPYAFSAVDNNKIIKETEKEKEVEKKQEPKKDDPEGDLVVKKLTDESLLILEKLKNTNWVIVEESNGTNSSQEDSEEYDDIDSEYDYSDKENDMENQMEIDNYLYVDKIKESCHSDLDGIDENPSYTQIFI
jgi:hypothetical protein